MEFWQGDLPDFIKAARSQQLASSMAQRYREI